MLPEKALPPTRASALKNKTVAEAKHRLITELSPTSPSPQLDADCILQWVLDCDRTHLLLRRNELLTEEQAAAVEDALSRRATGFPIAYITGRKEFFGLDFFVTPAVLIPKPDTELLVEQTIAAVREKCRGAASGAAGKKIRVCDMCTGSGCVGISVLRALTEDDVILSGAEESSRQARNGNGTAEDKDSAARTEISLTLVDISEDALSVAKKNAERLLHEREKRRGCTQMDADGTSVLRKSSADSSTYSSTISFVRSNLFERVPGQFDFIVTNPPYVPHTEAQALLRDGRSEPLLALDGDVTEDGGWSGTEDGLALIRRLVPDAYAHLVSGGMLLMETGEYNAEETAELFARAGFCDIRIERDLSGQMRDVIGRKAR